jgi:hypothetical protein
MGMLQLMNEDRFSFLSTASKEFILAFDSEITPLGYNFGGSIGGGACWGNYMIIYSKSDAKAKKVVARIYIREEGIVLRLYFSQIDKHRGFIEQAPKLIKEVFAGEQGKCGHCNNEKDGSCKFRKSYTIDQNQIDKCNGKTFEFYNPTLDKLQDYIKLFKEFYAPRKAVKQ